MRLLGFLIGLALVIGGGWLWQQPAVENEELAATVNLKNVDNFGADLGDFGALTGEQTGDQDMPVPPPEDWVIKAPVPPAESAPLNPHHEPSWLVITQPFTSQSAAKSFSLAIAQETGLAVTVQNPDFREYQVAVQIDSSNNRDSVVATLQTHYPWMGSGLEP